MEQLRQKQTRIPGTRCMMLIASIAFLVSTTMAALAAETNQVVVPNGLAERFGSSSIQIPSSGLNEVQQINDAFQFASAPTDQIWISALALRWNERMPSLSTVVPAIEVHLSTFRGQLSGVQPGRGNNRGSDYRLAYSGRNVPFEATPSQSPSEFAVLFQFQEPFLYDRQAGQLVVDLGFFGEIPGGQSVGFDFERSSPFTRWVTDSAGGVFNEGLAIQFSYFAIPEPRPVSLLIVGIVTLFASREFRK